MKLFTIVCAAVLTCAGAFAAAADSITVHFATLLAASGWAG